MIIVLIVSSAIILIGVVIGALSLADFDGEDTTKVKFSESKTEGAVEFREMLVHPGETVGHTVLLTSEVEGECELSVSFKEYKPNLLANELKKYVYVTVTLGDAVICESVLLEELFSTELEAQVCELDSKEPLELDISFHMPIETGNEAEFTEAYFDVIISVSNE